MSERLFDGDLPEEKGTESNILATGEESVVQSLTTLKGDMHHPFSEVECKSPDPVLNSRGENTPKEVNVEREISGVDKVVQVLEVPSEAVTKRNDKEKGKLVDSSSAKVVLKYTTRGSQKKLMGDAMEANKSQTLRNRRKMKTTVSKDVQIVNPIDISKESMVVGSSEIESKDIVRVVAKIPREAEEKKISFKDQENQQEEGSK
ncbi:hypothetical protein KY290_036312 [Solanum tuberosum]|uniref:Uncharacterized protein n=1 Tax=Solanum tuberosum TaxID=4113 RepID=A0ABQ7TSB0_SOLTU|nr:hypothetical protein KY290_036312 [Solanum tuberosum]